MDSNQGEGESPLELSVTWTRIIGTWFQKAGGEGIPRDCLSGQTNPHRHDFYPATTAEESSNKTIKAGPLVLTKV